MYENYNVEVLFRGQPKHIISLNESSESNALRRAKSAIFMMALKDGREWPLDEIETRLYEGELVD